MKGTVVCAAVLVTGWAVGTAVGIGAGMLWDAASGDPRMTWVALTVPLGGLTGVVVATIWGLPAVLRRPQSPCCEQHRGS